LYFHAGGQLRDEPPPDARPEDGHDEYLSDPARPVPFLDKIAIGMAPEYMTADQRFAARRPDVLVYETGVLDEDVTVAGRVEADLFVATTGTDADWVVKLIDVYPDDYPDATPNPTGVKMAATTSWCAATSCAASSATASRSRSRSPPASRRR